MELKICINCRRVLLNSVLAVFLFFFLATFGVRLSEMQSCASFKAQLLQTEHHMQLFSPGYGHNIHAGPCLQEIYRKLELCVLKLYTARHFGEVLTAKSLGEQAYTNNNLARVQEVIPT